MRRVASLGSCDRDGQRCWHNSSRCSLAYWLIARIPYSPLTSAAPISIRISPQLCRFPRVLRGAGSAANSSSSALLLLVHWDAAPFDAVASTNLEPTQWTATLTSPCVATKPS